MQEDNLLSVGGKNSNLFINDMMYHIQTEVLLNKKVVVSEVYINGAIVLSDFFSFKKYYDKMVKDEPQKLTHGIKEVVNILHKKTIEKLKEKLQKSNDLNNEKELTLLEDWLLSVYENIINDYPEVRIKSLGVISNINTFKDGLKFKTVQGDCEFRDLMVLGTCFIKQVGKLYTKNKGLLYFESPTLNCFMVSPDNKLFSYISVDKKNNIGVVRLELKKYLPLLFKNLNI